MYKILHIPSNTYIKSRLCPKDTLYFNTEADCLLYITNLIDFSIYFIPNKLIKEEFEIIEE